MMHSWGSCFVHAPQTLFETVQGIIAQVFSTVPQASRPVLSRIGFFCGLFVP